MLSEFETLNPDFKSKAKAEIKRITFAGVEHGGASRCIAVPDGWYAPDKSVWPQQCEAGYQPNQAKSACEKCPQSFFNKQKGFYCQPCGEFTFPSEDRTTCIPYDIITDSTAVRKLLYLNSPS